MFSNKKKCFFFPKFSIIFLSQISAAGIWIETDGLHYLRNNYGGYNLFHNGYTYRREAAFKQSINWVCSRGRINGKHCTARCITRTNDAKKFIRFGRNVHCHSPKNLNLKDLTTDPS